MIAAVLIAASFAPLLLLGGSGADQAKVINCGVEMGWQESIIRSVAADKLPREKRPSSFGIFRAGYGIIGFIGSWALGALYDLAVKGKISLLTLVIFSVAVQFMAIPLYVYVAQRHLKGHNR
ncbi:MAG: hypothetical protein HY730_10400 [Candidatus Tectomicrobia bacterium]|uniref:Major facilitator superfamily (MFS) profile domain-containing protein n=1 Tax=Tectimicrobiota bacterium TaxID=2528274 RepID=A0A933GMR0_UNCTE|nr:hypothetical protein [Candidatus Tectomicrobia bacterium]